MMVYLAGPYKHGGDCTYKLKQIKILEKNKIKVNDPTITNGDFRGFNPMDSKVSTQIVEGDLNELRMCDGIVANIFQQSFGTAMEIAYAKLLGKAVIIITKDRKDLVSPWITYHADLIIDDLDEVSIKKIIKLLKNKEPLRKIRYGCDYEQK